MPQKTFVDFQCFLNNVSSFKNYISQVMSCLNISGTLSSSYIFKDLNGYENKYWLFPPSLSPVVLNIDQGGDTQRNNQITLDYGPVKYRPVSGERNTVLRKYTRQVAECKSLRTNSYVQGMWEKGLKYIDIVLTLHPSALSFVLLETKSCF